MIVKIELIDLFKLAENYFQINDYQNCESILKKILDLDPNNTKANEFLSYIYGNQGNADLSYYFLELACNDHNCSPEALYYLGVAQIDRAKFINAAQSLKKAIDKGGEFFEGLYGLGTSYAFLGEHEISLEYFQKCLNYKKDSPELYFNLARVYDDLKGYDKALLYYDQALNLKPDYIEAWLNKGTTLNDLKRYEEALIHYDHVLDLKPDHSEAFFNKGNSFKKLKRYENAIAHFNRALDIRPDYIEAWLNKGTTLNDLKRYEEALIHYDHALDLKPEYAEAWMNKGVTLESLKRYDDAIAHFNRALDLKPEYAEAWMNKGAVLNKFKHYNDALLHCEKAITIDPDYAAAWSNRSVLLNQLGLYEKALESSNRALILRPDYPEAYVNKANSLKELNRHEEALKNYEYALSLEPELDWIFGEVIHTKMALCFWKNIDKEIIELNEFILLNKKITKPFSVLSITDNAYIQRKSAEIHVESIVDKNINYENIQKKINKKKINIGYFSADFRDHAVSFLSAEMFELHDKNKFSTFAFSFGIDDGSSMRRRLIQSFDQFIDIQNKSDTEIINLARKLEIDIAVDLTGYTYGSRSDVFAHRIAPIQVNYLGYPGTTGSKFMDYIIADQILIPEEVKNYYSEKIIYLPNSYQVNDRQRPISDRKFSRDELGLPSEGFVFACFNNNYKILPSIFNVWMEILKETDNSVLWLFQSNHSVMQNLRSEAKKRDVDPKRIIFAKRLNLADHLARHANADLFLDTFPYNAHTTASDALWAGLPILTLTGQSFASRVAASLLCAIDMPELITTSTFDYKKLAIELATNPNKLSSLRKKLIDNRLSTPLFDTPLFTKHIESAYAQIFERHIAGLQPDDIKI